MSCMKNRLRCSLNWRIFYSMNCVKCFVMRSAFKILFLLFASIVVCSAKVSADTDSLWIKANDAYSMSEFNKAMELYGKIESQGLESWKLYYNMGNACFKTGNIGKAILYYEKALKLNPAEDDIVNNLELARLQTVDKITPVPEFVMSTFIKRLQNLLSSDTWTWFSIVMLAVVFAMLLCYRFATQGRAKKLSFAFSIVAALMFILSLVFAINLRNRALSYDYGIITQPMCNVKSAPNNGGGNLFVLHEGTKVEILEQVGGWSKIEIADGRQGWTEQRDYTII